MKKWKWLFISLLAINVIFLIVTAGLALQPSQEKELSLQETAGKQNVSLGITAKKEDLNIIINEYLRKEFKQPLNYEIRLTDKVEVYGTIEAFGNELDIRMDFEPEVQNDGNLVLKQESLSVGKLSLPVKTVLKYVNNNFSLPQWVQINSKEESVYVALQEMKMKSDFRVKVKKFDLKKNDIEFMLTANY
jgi:uncharacterized protein YpmS